MLHAGAGRLRLSQHDDEILCRIFQTIIDHPDDPKYRCVFATHGIHEPINTKYVINQPNYLSCTEGSTQRKQDKSFKIHQLHLIFCNN